MKILGIETSCDETSISVIEGKGGIKHPAFTVLSHALLSQIDLHTQYGGVFPAMAKREHAKNLVPILTQALASAGFKHNKKTPVIDQKTILKAEKILEREHELFELLRTALPALPRPDIDMIAVTSGPGLEPALWVGINFALALGAMWDIPVMPVNHLEGHIMSVLYRTIKKTTAGFGNFHPNFPALALIISGGHTELVLVKDWMKYKIVGKTRDDAVGECFDKVARMLSLPYPGGPQISKLAAEAREKNIVSEIKLPRPMINSNDLDFSFSGLKTAVLYTLQKIKKIDTKTKLGIAREFEDSVIDVLVRKTEKAMKQYKTKSLIIGGGVIANTAIRQAFQGLTNKHDTRLFVPEVSLSTDNAIMIAMAGYFHAANKKIKTGKTITADGNLSL